jgi:hypothetical protein
MLLSPFGCTHTQNSTLFEHKIHLVWLKSRLAVSMQRSSVALVILLIKISKISFRKNGKPQRSLNELWLDFGVYTIPMQNFFVGRRLFEFLLHFAGPVIIPQSTMY